MTEDEKIKDEALAEGLDIEFMRINREIEELIRSRNARSSYGRGQIFILREIQKRITYPDWRNIC